MGHLFRVRQEHILGSIFNKTYKLFRECGGVSELKNLQDVDERSEVQQLFNSCIMKNGETPAKQECIRSFKNLTIRIQYLRLSF